MRTVILLVLLNNVLWYGVYQSQTRKYESLTQKFESLDYENQANDRAATECAVKTGFRYNCADGTQKVSCQ